MVLFIAIAFLAGLAIGMLYLFSRFVQYAVVFMGGEEPDIWRCFFVWMGTGVLSWILGLFLDNYWLSLIAPYVLSPIAYYMFFELSYLKAIGAYFIFSFLVLGFQSVVLGGLLAGGIIIGIVFR